jgi:hypothetical protein
MTSLDPVAWHEFFVALAGAAAALTGLLFVAVSLNLKQILAYPSLPVRVGETLVIMMGLVLLSVFMLIPGQNRYAAGTEILVLGLVLTGLTLRWRMRLTRSADDPLRWTLIAVGIVLASTVPMVVAGISVLAGGGGGFYWLVPAVVLALVGAIANAWVLLIEIVR